MKILQVLFGLNQSSDNSTEEKILEMYQKKISEVFKYKKEFDLTGIKKQIIFNKYDILILNELLEKQNTVTTEFLDELTDKYPDLRIIFVIDSEKHEKDSYVKRLYNIGIYDIVYSHDLLIDVLVNLIIGGRTKAEAKNYLDLIDTDDDIVEEELGYIPQQELDSILDYFSDIEDKMMSSTFEHICRQYNEKQIIFLIKVLPKNIIKVLENENNETFKRHYDLIEHYEPIEVYEEDSTKKGAIFSFSKKSKKDNLKEDKEAKLITKNIVSKSVDKKSRGRRGLVIGIGAVNSGSGTTHTTLGLASYLKKNANKIAVAEFNNKPQLNRLMAYSYKKNEDYFSVNKLDLYCQKNTKQNLDDFYQMLLKLKSNNYDYIIIDFGELKSFDDNGILQRNISYNEMCRADYQILCLNGSSWKWEDINFYRCDDFAEVEPYINNWVLTINLIDDSFFKNITKEIKNITVLKDIKKAPLYLDPFDINKEISKYFEDLIKYIYV